MEKIKVHYHSDNPYWAASEQMIICFLNSQLMGENYRRSFSFRYTPEYVNGMVKWFDKAGLMTWTDADTTLRYLDNYWLTSIWRMPLGFFDPNINFTLCPLKFPITKFFKYRLLRGILKYVFYPYDVLKLYLLFRKIRPDIVHVQNGGWFGAISCHAASVAGKMIGAKIIHMCNAIEEKPKWRWMLDWPVGWLTINCVDQFVIASRDNARILEDCFKRPVKAIPNTIHEHKYQRNPDDIITELGLKNDDILICSVGVFEERKGIEHIISAFNKFRERNLFVDKTICLLLVGNGSQQDYFNRLTSRANNSFSKIFFVNDTLNAYSYINASDIYVYFPVAEEDFSLTMLMALKAGKPIVASDITGNKDMIDHVINGYLISPDYPNDMVEYLSLFVRKADFRKVFGYNSQVKFKREYSEPVIMKKYLDLYQELLK